MKDKITRLGLLLLCMMCLRAYSQTVTGRVLNEEGVPLAGATITAGKNGAATDIDGKFKIVLSKLPDTLHFNYVGYQSYKVMATAKTVKDTKFEVVMLKSRNELNEVVVVGYHSPKRKDVVGSTASVSASKLAYEYESMPPPALEGRAAGVEVSGTGASIRIRGAGSVAGAPMADRMPIASGKKVIFNDSLAVDENNKVLKTKLVTAGEINDFNKWKMWEDFTERDFKVYGQYWKLYPKQRFCAQLQNDAHAPVVGKEIYLIDKNSHDTVWRAVTDNTGKAELWAGMDQDVYDAKKEYSIESNHAKAIDRPAPFEQGINRMKLNTPCNTNNTVDIAFVVDATGSMGDEIEFLKLELEEVLRNTSAQFTDLDLRAASVFYRDDGDQYLTKHVDFDNDLLKTMNFIKLQKADGGGDTPEAVEAALHTALDSLTWSSHARTKLLFLVLDAPPHNGTQADLYALMQKAASNGVRIIPIVCSGADKSTEFLMRSLALATNGTYVFLTDNSGIGNTHMKPTTDVFSVELLNNLLQRLIRQTVYVPTCNDAKPTEPDIKLPDNILNVKISPNPTSGRIVIKSNKPLKEIYVADFTGKILMRLMKGNSKTEQWETDLSAYPSGTYIVKYITTENEWGAGKVIVVR